MKTEIITLAAICGLGLLYVPGLADSNSTAKNQNDKSDQVLRAQFRYVIVSSSVNRELNCRDVEVLLDETAFSEETLAQLYQLISKRYPKPRWMFVNVATSLKQISTPEEKDAPVISESDHVPELDPHPRAVLIRQGDSELFRYTVNPPSTKMKTVILKGKDPNPSM
jgi:hypothetical protein